jgi:aryl-alcohol dehydrogenase-like predicted oxidoreductase
MAATRWIGSLEVSVAGLGCNNFGMRIDEDATRAVIDAAIDTGVNHFDTAESYGGGKSEEFIGNALGARRDGIVITTKVASGDPARIAEAIDGSLQRLRTDHVDLYLLHRPDDEFPIEETVAAFAKVVADGKAREIGCSNFSAEQLDAAAAAASELGVRGFVNVQNHYSLLERAPDAEVIPEVERLGMTLVPYFPLASGMLTGKYTRGEPAPEGTRLALWGDRAGAFMSDERFDVVEALSAYAAEHGHTLPELALSWVAGAPTVASVIAGATKPEQVRANAAATEAWDLTADERADIDAITSRLSTAEPG